MLRTQGGGSSNSGPDWEYRCVSDDTDIWVLVKSGVIRLRMLEQSNLKRYHSLAFDGNG